MALSRPSTERKRQANQRNAKRSTGPRTSAGKDRSKQNAWKHGLSVAVRAQPHFVDLLRELESGLEWDIAPTPSAKEDLGASMIAMLEVLRARSVRARILDELIQHCDPSVAGAAASKSSAAELMQHLLRTDRYERRALSRRKSAIQSFSETIKGPGRSDVEP